VISPEQKNLVELFSQGRKHYNMMQFQEAKKCFIKALEVKPADGPSKVYLERCDYYINNPPPADWDGVYVMKTK